jgi:hypothetical protein
MKNKRKILLISLYYNLMRLAPTWGLQRLRCGRFSQSPELGSRVLIPLRTLVIPTFPVLCPDVSTLIEEHILKTRVVDTVSGETWARFSWSICLIYLGGSVYWSLQINSPHDCLLLHMTLILWVTGALLTPWDLMFWITSVSFVMLPLHAPAVLRT